jgi:hypothetical protein
MRSRFQWKVGGGLALGVAMTLLALPVANAGAAPAANPIPGAISSGLLVQVPSGNPNVTVYEAAPGLAVKQELVQQIEAYQAAQPQAAAQVGVAPDISVGQGDNSLGRYGTVDITPPGTSSQEAEAGFSSTADVSGGHVAFSGNSYSYWLGLDPIDWTSGSLYNGWSVSGIDVSFSLPLGIGFSGSGSSESQVQGSSPASNWTITEDFGDVDFGGESVTSADESAGFDMTLNGKAFYYPDLAND